ncbi:hypothetical protein WJX72_006624 [[Myrmecia] bisecta]|uniref:Inositol-pentakisphosphate 2-kinase n=1 Tax=[Myrmecia] bisecta TaxID=41462 RepID=A0AAW1PGB2_9CHLO
MDLGRPEEWDYKGEGNANAVFSYVGTLPFLKSRVLRVKKLSSASKATARTRQSPAEAGALAQLEQCIWGPVLGTTDGVAREVAYQQGVMAEIIGRQYVLKQEQVELPEDLAARLAEKLWQHGRPACGRQAIRPDHDIKRRISRYALHQQLKLAQGSISRASAYDPLDLFSGTPAHMTRALHALVEDPQNNLKLFCNGRPADSSQLQALVQAWLQLDSRDAVAALVRLLQQVLSAEGV